MIYVTECPRDAMQGIKNFIPTESKITYLQSLIETNFDVLDCGSFVSPKVIPQMKDTHEVLKNLDLGNSTTKLSVIVANESGAKRALEEEKVNILGFPFSVSEKFQLYNTNATREEGVERINKIFELTKSTDKELLVYISMGFGNPYGEIWNIDLVKKYVEYFIEMGVKNIKLSDTIGAAKKDDIAEVFDSLIKSFPEITFGAHFHTEYDKWYDIINTAYENGCRDFDGAIQGYGGCPMSKTDLVGNMPTEKLITFINQKNETTNVDSLAFESAFNKALTLFNNH